MLILTPEQERQETRTITPTEKNTDNQGVKGDQSKPKRRLDTGSIFIPRLSLVVVTENSRTWRLLAPFEFSGCLTEVKYYV